MRIGLKSATLLFSTFFLVSHSAYAAEDIPTMGMLYNTKEVSYLTYKCKPISGIKISCDFIQTAVRKKAKPEEIKKKLDEAKKQFPEALKEISSEKSCTKDLSYIEPFTKYLSGENTAEETAEILSKEKNFNKKEFLENMVASSEEDKQELLKTMKTLQNFCKERSEESFLALTKVQLDKDAKTCTVSGGNTFTQTLTYVNDGISTTGSWVVENTPDGPCGIVRLDRFVPDETTIGDKKYINWKYVAKKAVTNPDGTILGDLKCDQADEGEYLYDWKTSAKTDRLYHLGCEYIEFSPI